MAGRATGGLRRESFSASVLSIESEFGPDELLGTLIPFVDPFSYNDRAFQAEAPSTPWLMNGTHLLNLRPGLSMHISPITLAIRASLSNPPPSHLDPVDSEKPTSTSLDSRPAMPPQHQCRSSPRLVGCVSGAVAPAHGQLKSAPHSHPYTRQASQFHSELLTNGIHDDDLSLVPGMPETTAKLVLPNTVRRRGSEAEDRTRGPALLQLEHSDGQRQVWQVRRRSSVFFFSRELL